MFLRFETAILSFDAFQAKPSPRFLESRRMIAANRARGSPIFLNFWLAVLQEKLLRHFSDNMHVLFEFGSQLLLAQIIV
jgi:hypothetical protein